MVPPMTSVETSTPMMRPDLLLERRGADEIAGLEILRGGAGVGGGDADDGADHERHRLVGVAGPADARRR